MSCTCLQIDHLYHRSRARDPRSAKEKKYNDIRYNVVLILGAQAFFFI